MKGTNNSGKNKLHLDSYLGTSSMNSNVSGWGAAATVQKKTIDIFNYKQRLLSLGMKTKVVQHVPRNNLSYFKFQI